MLNISKWNYGEYSSDNYGAHSLAFETAQGVFYFSYDTCVAFKSSKTHNFYVRENVWGSTTGKHLNWIDGGNKKNRLTKEDFEKVLKEEGVL